MAKLIDNNPEVSKDKKQKGKFNNSKVEKPNKIKKAVKSNTEKVATVKPVQKKENENDSATTYSKRHSVQANIPDEEFKKKYPIFKNVALVNKFLSLQLTNNQKGRIRQQLRETLKGTSPQKLPNVIYDMVKAFGNGTDEYTEVQLRKIRILYNMLRTAIQNKNNPEKVEKNKSKGKDNGVGEAENEGIKKEGKKNKKLNGVGGEESGKIKQVEKKSKKLKVEEKVVSDKESEDSDEKNEDSDAEEEASDEEEECSDEEVGSDEKEDSDDEEDSDEKEDSDDEEEEDSDEESDEMDTGDDEELISKPGKKGKDIETKLTVKKGKDIETKLAVKKGKDIETKLDVKKGKDTNTKLDGKKGKDIKVKGPKRYVVFVGNLPLDTDKEKIMKHFSNLKEQIVDVRIPPPAEGKKSTIAYVELKNSTSYEMALSKHHSMMSNRRINVMFTAQKNSKLTNTEAKGKAAKLAALRTSGKLAGSAPLAKKRSQRRTKARLAQKKLDIDG